MRLFSLCAFTAFLPFTGLLETYAADKPNIVFIMSDDLGYNELGCYGQKILKTPYIDKLASQGLRFTDCYAGSTVCAPSRCVLMTGLHTGHAHVRGNGGVPLRPNDVTVAELVQQAGYTTGMFGKWGLGEPGTTGIPNYQGFDEWFGYLNQGLAHNYYPEYLWLNQTKHRLIGNVSENRVARQKVQYSHFVVMEQMLKFIEEQKDKPFFLYVPFTLPHVNNELRRATGDGMEVPHYGQYANEDWPKPEKGRAMMIHLLDEAVGQLMAKLDEAGVAENTLVFFTNDNGAQQEGGSKIAFFDSCGPLRGFKRDLYEGGIRVPMIVRWPGKVAANKVSDFPWAFWDVLPTVTEIVGAEAPKNLDGQSVLPTLLGRSQKPAEFMYWEFHERGITQAVRMGDWKGVRFGLQAQLELYNLKNDRGETTNVAKKNPSVVKKIETYLATARTDSKHFPVRERKRTKKTK